MRSWKEPKPVLSLLAIVAAAVLIYTGALPEFIQGGLLVGGIMGFMMYHYDQRQPTREEFLEMIGERIADDLETYLGFMNEESEEES